MSHLAYTLPVEIEREFFFEFERSGAPALLRELLGGDFFVGISERVIRRADAAVATRFSGLHQDGQLGPCSRAGINSKREFTIWTPLVDCTDEETPRLLLLQRGQTFANVFSEAEHVEDRGARFLPIQLRPHEDGKVLNDFGGDDLDQMFARIYNSTTCFAPRIPLGSAIFFDRDIVHGSYRHSRMRVPRFSLDFRVTGSYQHGLRDTGYHGVLFSSLPFPSARRRKLARVAQVARGLLFADADALAVVRKRLPF